MGRKVNVFKWPPGTVNTAWLGITQDKSSRTEIHENLKKKKKNHRIPKLKAWPAAQGGPNLACPGTQ